MDRRCLSVLLVKLFIIKFRIMTSLQHLVIIKNCLCSLEQLNSWKKESWYFESMSPAVQLRPTHVQFRKVFPSWVNIRQILRDAANIARLHVNFRVADYVILGIPCTQKPKKWQSRWPYQVTAALNDFVYQIRHLLTRNLVTVHVSWLIFYCDQLIDEWNHELHHHIRKCYLVKYWGSLCIYLEGCSWDTCHISSLKHCYSESAKW